MIRTRETTAFRVHALRRALGNFSLLRHRDYRGFIVSMHQAGTHWFKFMLASALARQHGLAPPRYNHANEIIGGPHDPRPPAGIPALASSHSIAHPLLRVRAVHRLLRLPRYVVLVRDPRASLISNYEKWKTRYGVSFPEFLEGDPRGRRYNSDLWWCIRFLNAWGAVVARVPERTLVVRYEDLLADPGAELERVEDFLALGLQAPAIAAAVAGATKAHMAARHDPGRPPGEVRRDERPIGHWFGPAEQARLAAICQICLVHDFGYRLAPPAASAS